MRNFLCILIIVLLSCGQPHSTEKKVLKDWILAHEKELVFQSDSFIVDYRNEHPAADWQSADIAITNSMSGPLGQLADKAGDSTNCIVVVLTIPYNGKDKRRIFLTATDSICLQKLNKIDLPTDSTNDIVFGKSGESLE